jgi:hypothetical protein
MGSRQLAVMIVAAVVFPLAVGLAPRHAAAGDGAAGAGDVKVVSGGPKDAGKRKALVASVAAIVGRDLGVCLRADRPATVRVELAVGADGAVTAATQRTEGAVAQCVAGILAVKTLAKTGAACTLTVEIGLGAMAEDLAAAVDRQLAAERATLAGCQQKDVKATGGIDLKFTIEKDGRIGAITAAKHGVGKPIEECLRTTLASLKLALPEAKAVKYALHLDFAGGASTASGAGKGREPVLSTPGEAKLEIAEKSATATGTLDTAAVNRVVRDAQTAWLACYRKQQKTNPDLAYGKVVVRFTVRADGTVKNTAIKESNLDDKTLETCIVNVAKKLAFPTSEGETKLVLPLMFSN